MGVNMHTSQTDVIGTEWNGADGIFVSRRWQSVVNTAVNFPFR